MLTGKTTLRNIFDASNIFNVPIYQRSYSWDNENLNEFLSDLINQQTDRPYFLGSYLFHTKEKRGDFNIVDIVDGQQRLTTFVIFMREILSILEINKSSIATTRSKRIFIKDEEVFKIELSNENSSFLHHQILSENFETNVSAKTPSQSRLIEAKSFFKVKLQSLDQLTLEKIFKVATEADILIYVVDEISQATQIFELLNDRGRKLTDLESIKSFLMYTVGLSSKNPNQTINTIQQNFGEIYRIIESNSLNEKDILRYHTIAFEHPTENPKKQIKEKIKGILMKNSDISTLVSEAIDYSIRLKKSFELFEQINKDKFDNLELTKFFMMERVSPFYPFLFRIYSEDKSNLNEILVKLNGFTFKAIAIGLRGKLESIINHRLWNGGLKAAKDELFSAIPNNKWNINKRASTVFNSKFYYGSLNHNLLRYTLVCYENSLRSNNGYPKIGLREYHSNVEREKLSVEHITAQKASVHNFNTDFKDNYLHNIGNLVIDNKASNSSKGNKDGDSKLPYFQEAPIMSQNQIHSKICDWNNIESIIEFITNREIEIKNYISIELLKDKLS